MLRVEMLLGLMTLLRVPGQHLLLLLVLGVSTVLVALPWLGSLFGV